MKHLLTAAIIAAASPAIACDSISIHIASYHTDRELIVDVNESNFGIGCRFDDVAYGVSIESGLYLNSYDDVSPYAVAIGDPDGLSWFAGVAGGYSKDIGVPDHGFTGMAGIQYGADTFTVRASPSYNGTTGSYGAVLGFSLSIPAGASQ